MKLYLTSIKKVPSADGKSLNLRFSATFDPELEAEGRSAITAIGCIAGIGKDGPFVYPPGVRRASRFYNNPNWGTFWEGKLKETLLKHNYLVGLGVQESPFAEELLPDVEVQ